MFRKGILLGMFFMVTLIVAQAQTGTIKGSVKDAISGEAVIGANVLIAGTLQGSAADINGEFEVTGVKVGKYNLIISFISYRTDTLRDVTVYADQITLINTTLVEESTSLSEVVVAAQRVKNTDISVMSDIKHSQLVVAGISAQQISLSQDRDAAQIVKRIPGVTIVNNRFVNVRGLSERYNTVLLNGVIAPSTEVDSRAFAFDLIPSNMIDRMMVYKSGSPEYSGEFAGAVINIETKSIVDENALSVNFTTGFRNGTTGKDFYTHQGSNTDWLGFDNGFRELPSSFPDQNLGEVTNIDGVSRMLPNNWSTTKQTAAPDFRAAINFSRVADIGSKRLSNLTSISYSNTKQSYEQAVNFFLIYRPQEQKSDLSYSNKDNIYSTNSRVGVISNFILELNPSNRIEFRNLFNQQGNSQTTFREGTNFDVDQNSKDLAMNYYSRQIYSGQLNGKHSLSDRTNVSWVIGYSSVNGNQPDYRNISARKSFVDAEYSIVIPPSASIQDGGRFFSKLNESVYTQATNIELKLNPGASDNVQNKFSLGYYVAYTDRKFNARWFSYGSNSINGTPPSVLTGASFTEIFKPENIGSFQSSGNPPYFILNEGTSETDSYGGKNLLTAGYLNFSLALSSKVRVTPGVRAEYNKQELLAKETSGAAANINNPVMSILPFLNVTYNYSEKSLVRLAYSKTVNRPIFRELAGFNYYDFDRKANLFGNPDLKTADVNNIDLRWENYPANNESMSIGLFYKHFKNPIEQILYGGSNLLYTYGNADKAISYGVEAEFRKSLESVFHIKALQYFSVLFNASLIKSEVQYGANVTTQESNRAMQGQSPYIVNAGLYYNNYERGIQANVSYNVFGERIFAVGDKDQFATQYEMPRNQLDITISKEFANKFEAKLGVQDLLNQRYRLIQDSNHNQKIDGIDESVRNYKLGQYVTFGVTYKLY